MLKFVRESFILLLISGLCEAQFKVITLDEGGGEDRDPSEPSIAINPLNTDNIVVGAILDKVYFTLDGGKTWETRKLESSYGVWGDPFIVSDKKGIFHYFHLSDPTGKNWESEEILDRMVVQSSEDGGATWNDGSYFGYNPPKDQDKEWVTVNHLNNDLIATWTQFDKYGSADPDHESNVLFSMSSNRGKKWSKPVILNALSGDCLDGDQTTMGVTSAVDLFGRIYVAWAYNEKIYFDRSFDEGKTWLGKDMDIADQVGGWDMDVPGVYRCNGLPILVTDASLYGFRGMIYLVWSDQRNGPDNTDIWMIKSNSFGDRWTPPLLINNDSTETHQFSPWMTIDQVTGYLYILFYDRRNYDDLHTDVYLAYSTDGGFKFENVKINDEPFIPDGETFMGDYINVNAHNGRIAAVWTHMEGTKTSIKAVILNQTDLGLAPIKIKDEVKKKKKGKKEKDKS